MEKKLKPGQKLKAFVHIASQKRLQSVDELKFGIGRTKEILPVIHGGSRKQNGIENGKISFRKNGKKSRMLILLPESNILLM